MSGRADAGEHEDLGRVVSTRRHQHFAIAMRRLLRPALNVVHRAAAAALDDEARDVASVSMVRRGSPMTCDRKASTPLKTPVAPRGILHRTDATLLRPVEVRVVGNPKSLRRKDVILRQLTDGASG